MKGRKKINSFKQLKKYWFVGRRLDRSGETLLLSNALKPKKYLSNLCKSMERFSFNYNKIIKHIHLQLPIYLKVHQINQHQVASRSY